MPVRNGMPAAAAFLQIGDADPIARLGRLDPALLRRRFVRLRKVDDIARMRQRRAQRAAGLLHRGDALGVEVEAVEDQIDPGTRRV